MAFEESDSTPNPASASAAADATDAPTSDELRRLLMDDDEVRVPATQSSSARSPTPSRAGERMVSVRVGPERYEVLAALAAEEGVPATTMARLLLNRALREAEHNGPRL